MAFDVKYDDITTFYLTLSQMTGQINEGLTNIVTALDNMIQMESFKGNTAENMKNYMQEVSYTLIGSAMAVLSELETQCLLYKDGYANIDENSHFRINQDKLTEVSIYHNNGKMEFGEQHSKVYDAMRSVADLISVDNVDPSPVQESYHKMALLASNLEASVGNYENKHIENDFTLFRDMISELNNLIGEISDGDSGPAKYRAKDILSSPSMKKLEECLVTYGGKQAALSEDIAAASKREVERFKKLEEEWSQARIEEGWQKKINGTLEIVGGVFVIVGSSAIIGVSCGLATPLALAGMTSGALMMMNGGSNVWEGMEDIHYGKAGNPYAIAVNPLRDTLFAAAVGEEEKQKAWDTFGTACAIVGTVSGLGSVGGAIGAKGGVKAVGKFAAGVGVSAASGAGAEAFGKWAARKAGVSDTVADTVGVLSRAGVTVAVGAALSKIGTKPAKSGGKGTSGGKFTKQEVEDMTKAATHNADSKNVTLGKWEKGAGSYTEVAKSKGDTYFDMGTEGWNSAAKKVNNSSSEMWKINKKFLDKQIKQGKNFNLTHDPIPGSKSYTGFYRKEIDYLIGKGYKIITKGKYWYAYK